MTAHRLLAPLAALSLTVTALAGCGDVADRVQQEAGEASAGVFERAVADRVQQELEQAGVDLESAPDCTSDVDLSNLADGASGSIECTGRTTGGDDVTADFSGEFELDGSCGGRLVATVAGEERLRTPEINVCGGGTDIPQ